MSEIICDRDNKDKKKKKNHGEKEIKYLFG